MVTSTEQNNGGLLGKEKQRRRIDTLSKALGVLAEVQARQPEITSDDPYAQRRQLIRYAGEALTEVLVSAPVVEPMLYEMVEQVYDVDSTELTTEYFDLIRDGALRRDGLGYSRGHHAQEPSQVS